MEPVRPLLCQLIGSLPDAHQKLVEKCSVQILPTQIIFDVPIDPEGRESDSILLDDLKRAEWSIANAIIETGFPDRFSIHLNGVPQKEYAASQSLRKQRLQIQAMEKPFLT